MERDRAIRNRALRTRLKALQGVGQKNPDADHAKQCGNCLDHHKLSFRPRGNKTAGPAEQSKEFNERCRLRRAADDFRQQTMSGRWQAAGELGFRTATPGLKVDFNFNCHQRQGRNQRACASSDRTRPPPSPASGDAGGERSNRAFAKFGALCLDHRSADQVRGSFGMLSANPLKQASRSSCSLTKRQSFTAFAAGGFGLGFGATIAS
jgi:hypothetical protein